ncbi:hypothetical protein EMIT053CA3_150099 [Pseudomonas donghuensis]
MFLILGKLPCYGYSHSNNRVRRCVIAQVELRKYAGLLGFKWTLWFVMRRCVDLSR